MRCGYAAAWMLSMCVVGVAWGMEASATSESEDEAAVLEGVVSEEVLEEEYVNFPAVGIELIRPAGFEEAENFHGFQQPAAGASVMLVMLPGSFEEATAAFAEEPLQARGMVLKSKEKLEVAGKPAVLVKVTQELQGLEFSKWLLAFGDEKETRMVLATFPSASGEEMSEKLREVVLSARQSEVKPAEPGAEVGFTIEASEKMVITSGLGGVGKMVLYTREGVFPPKSAGEPVFIAAPSLSAVAMGDRREYAVQRLFQTAHTKITSLTSIKEITIDGMEGYELAAEAEDLRSGNPLAVYMVIVFDEGSYILMQGMVGAGMREEYVPEFEAMARSMTRRVEEE